MCIEGIHHLINNVYYCVMGNVCVFLIIFRALIFSKTQMIFRIKRKNILLLFLG